MYCPHCGAPLAKAEIAADNTYKDVTEEAVTIKFKLKYPQQVSVFPENTYSARVDDDALDPSGQRGARGRDLIFAYVRCPSKTANTSCSAQRPEGTAHGRPRYAGELLDTASLSARIMSRSTASDAVEAPHKGKKHVQGARGGLRYHHRGHRHRAHGRPCTAKTTSRSGKKKACRWCSFLTPNGTYNDNAPEFVRSRIRKEDEANYKGRLWRRRDCSSRAPDA